MSKTRQGAEIIVDHLIAEKVPYLFGLCGHGIVGLMNAALDRRDRIRTVSVHNEQIAGFAADAYYRVSRQPVATFTSCGPGSVNIQMAIANALLDSSAVLAITGNIPTQQFNKGPFQEFGQHYQADYVSAMRPYVKRSFQASRPDMLPSMMRLAFNEMLAGRVGPVHLDVPFNVFVESAECELEGPDTWRSRRPSGVAAADADIGAALDLLLAAKRPLILAGHGCLLGSARSSLQAFSRATGIPVATTPQGKGVLADDEALYLGLTGRDGTYPGNRAVRGCDVLLAIGTRFGDRGTSSWHEGATHSASTQLIHVDIEPAALSRNYPTAVGIIGDAAMVLAQLLQAAGARPDADPGARAAWREETGAWKARWADTIAPGKTSDALPLHPGRVVADLAQATPKDAIVLSDIGQHHSWMVQQWPIAGGRQFLQSGGAATMGFGVGGAIGAAFAGQGRPVVAVVGDGGMLMHASAIATAVECGLPIVWLVWNNCGYVSIRDIQKGFFGDTREFATRFRAGGTEGELLSTDFAMLANAMGATGVRIERAQDISAQVEAAIACRKPVVLDVRVSADTPRFTSGTWNMPPLLGSAPNFDPYPLN